MRSFSYHREIRFGLNVWNTHSLDPYVIFTHIFVFVLSIFLLGLAYLVNDNNDLGGQHKRHI